MTVYAALVIGYGRAGRAALSVLQESGLGPLLCVERRAPEPGAPPEVRWDTTAVGVLPGFPGEPHSVMLRSAGGQEVVQAQRVLICTGGHEVPREGLGIPGTRPSGIMTGVMAEELMAMGLLPGYRVVLYGQGTRARRVADRLRQMGGRLVAELDPVTTELVRVEGFPRLQRVWVARRSHGAEGGAGEETGIDCDTLVISAQLEPGVHLLKGTGVILDEYTRGPQVDPWGRTSLPGVWAAGTCVAPLLEGEFSAELGCTAAGAMVREPAAISRPVRLVPGKGLRWVVPQLADAGATEPLRVYACTGRGEAVTVTIPAGALQDRDTYVVEAEEVNRG